MTSTLQSFISHLDVERISHIPRLQDLSVDDFMERHLSKGAPVILEGKVKEWPATQMWSPQYFKDKYPNFESSHAMIDSPEVGSLGFLKYDDHMCTIQLAEMISMIEKHGKNARMGDLPIHLLPGIEKECNFNQFINDFVGPQDVSPIISIWFGGPDTRSNLHWDPYDNFLGQFYGSKFVILFSPQESKKLYPFDGYVRVSRVDPCYPDYETYPKSRSAHMMIGLLEPGDLLYFPRGWWHQLRNKDFTIGVNCFFGKLDHSCSIRVAAAGGFRQWATIAHQFISLGVLGKKDTDKYIRVGGPTGRMYYDVLTGILERRLYRLLGKEPPNDD